MASWRLFTVRGIVTDASLTVVIAQHKSGQETSDRIGLDGPPLASVVVWAVGTSGRRLLTIHRQAAVGTGARSDGRKKECHCDGGTMKHSFPVFCSRFGHIPEEASFVPGWDPADCFVPGVKRRARPAPPRSAGCGCCPARPESRPTASWIRAGRNELGFCVVVHVLFPDSGAAGSLNVSVS